MCCAESQITGSPPLLSDLDILCEMEHEGPILHDSTKGKISEADIELLIKEVSFWPNGTEFDARRPFH